MCRNLTVLILLALAAPVHSDEATLTDGKRLPGTASVDANSKLRFTPRGQTEPLPVDAIRAVRFDAPAPPPLRVTGVRCVHFGTGERVTGQWLGTDNFAIRLRTGWAKDLSIRFLPGALVTPRPGQRVIFEDDFRSGLGGWETTGKPATDGELVLARVGQSIACRPKQPITAGELAVNCHSRGDRLGGPRWILELEFQGEKKGWLRVEVSPEKYIVQAEPIDGVARLVRTRDDWQRLRVRFSGHSTAVFVDEEVVWHNLERGLGEALRQVRLACVEGGRDPIPRQVAFAEFSLSATTADRPIRRDRDKVVLANGDEVFSADRPRGDWRAVEVTGPFGKRSLPWSELSAVYYDPSECSPFAPNRNRARVYLRTSWSGEPDMLEGDIKGLAEGRLTLKHERLGDVVLELAHVKEVRLP